MRSRQRHITPVAHPKTVEFECEAEVITGLESIARTELITQFGRQMRFPSSIVEEKSGQIRFYYNGNLRDLFRLRTVASVYLAHYFPVPRPRALLGHEQLHILLRQIETIQELHSRKTFASLHIDAAGSDSSVMTRLKEELSHHTGLSIDDEAGDLQIRIRRHEVGWETLMRLTPRPLSTRMWRVCNYEGALNATVAHAMALLTRPKPNDTFLNIACGSGSILIERLACMSATHIIGCDYSKRALGCAAENVAASHSENEINLLQCDVQSLPLPRDSVDAVCADLPFGQRTGSHEENLVLYPRIIDAAARVAKPGARFVVITHEIRLLDSLLRRMNSWQLETTLKITLRGLHPRIYVLKKV